jgi:hypothetical protein
MLNHSIIQTSNQFSFELGFVAPPFKTLSPTFLNFICDVMATNPDDILQVSSVMVSQWKNRTERWLDEPELAHAHLPELDRFLNQLLLV